MEISITGKNNALCEHLSELPIIYLAFQNVIKIPKYMVHKITFCLE